MRLRGVLCLSGSALLIQMVASCTGETVGSEEDDATTTPGNRNLKDSDRSTISSDGDAGLSGDAGTTNLESNDADGGYAEDSGSAQTSLHPGTSSPTEPDMSPIATLVAGASSSTAELDGGQSDAAEPGVTEPNTREIASGLVEPLGNLVDCDIAVNATLSEAIGTVAIVTWSTNLEAIDSARIEFGPADTGVAMSAPVDLNEPDYRTLLLGMKADRQYVFHVIANGGEDSCISDDQLLTTEPLPDMIPALEVEGNGEHIPGFLVTSGGIGSFGGPGVGGGGGNAPAFIIDTDGDVVWWSPAPTTTSRARMDWEGKHMYMLALNVGGGAGEFRGVTMDGLQEIMLPPEMQEAHHDFAVAPGGVVTTMVHTEDCSTIQEWSPTTGVKTLVDSVAEIYQPVGDCHPNAIVYQPETETYTISDRNPNLFVKIDRQGNLLWQFGGENPLGNFFKTTESWNVNHGHQLLNNGHFLFFNNNTGTSASLALEFALDESSWTATKVWQYESGNASPTLGDVQRLEAEHTMVTYSNAGIIQEVNADSEVVRTITTNSFGYVIHRKSLYGPPPK